MIRADARTRARVPARAARLAQFSASETLIARHSRFLRSIVSEVEAWITELLTPTVLENVQKVDAAIPAQVSVVFQQLELRIAELLNNQGKVFRRTTDVAELTDKLSKAQFQRLLKAASILPDRAEQAKFIEQNINLIRSVAGQQLRSVKTIVEEAAIVGRSVRDITKEIEAVTLVSKSRANLIARDQILKLHSNITKNRQTRAGVRRYIWTTSNDERVRDAHSDLDGTTQSWDAPPISSDDGSQNHPGEDYQCRCIAFPVIEALADLNLNL